MTTCIAAKYDNIIEIAADSYVESGNTKRLTSEKICIDYVKHAFVFATAGNFAVINQLKVFLDEKYGEHNWPVGRITNNYIAKFVLDFHEFLGKYKICELGEFAFLIFWNGDLFKCGWGDVYKIETLDANGTGREFSLGVMAKGGTPLQALQLSCNHVRGTEFPIYRFVLDTDEMKYQYIKHAMYADKEIILTGEYSNEK
jgi:ATP-dependent protease HslVU (ClpYQ) peptidase subunit